MDKKDYQTIKFLLERKNCKADELRQLLGCSEKTVRTIIGNLNEDLKKNGGEIVSQYGKGYSLKITNRLLFDKALKEASRYEMVPSNPDERIEYLLYKLLMEGSFNIKDVCSELYVSDRLIRYDVEKLESYVKKYGMSVEKTSSNEIGLKGSEINIRLCIASLKSQMYSDHYVEVKEIVKYYLDKYSFRIADIVFDNFVKHILISIVRIRENNYILSNVADDNINETKEFKIANDIANALSNKYKLIYPMFEIQYLAMHLKGKKIIENSNVIVGNEIDGLVIEALDLIKETFGYDFTKNFDLRVSLCLHFEPMIARLKYGLSMENPILEQIKQNYSYAYTMALAINTLIVKKYGKSLTDGEIGYIALPIQLAMEDERKKAIRKKNVLLVCNLGRVSALMVKHRYEDSYGEYINNIDICSLNEIEKIDFTKYDLIFTTVPIKYDVTIPVIEVSYFSNDYDENILKSSFENNKYKGINEYFSPSCFITNKSFNTKEEILVCMCDCLKKEYGIDKDILESVHKRENLAPTDFIYKTAMPHSAELLTEKSHLCVLVLDKPFKWQTKEVQLIFLVLVGKDKADSQKFYSLISKFLLNKKFINRLIKDKDYDELINMMETLNV